MRNRFRERPALEGRKSLTLAYDGLSRSGKRSFVAFISSPDVQLPALLQRVVPYLDVPAAQRYVRIDPVGAIKAVDQHCSTGLARGLVEGVVGGTEFRSQRVSHDVIERSQQARSRVGLLGPC